MEQKELFIVYTGEDINSDELEKHLNQWLHDTDSYFIKEVNARSNGCFVSISSSDYDEDEMQPHDLEDMICVADCEYNEFRNFYDTYLEKFDYMVDDEDYFRQNFIHLFDIFGLNFLDKMSKKDKTYSLVLDDTECIIASRGKEHSISGKLYYGYSGSNNIMFSNGYDCLKKYCKNIQEFPANSYYKDGQFYSLNEDKAIGKSFQPLQVDDLAVKAFLAGLNSMLSDSININEKLEKMIDDYLKTFKSDKLTDEKFRNAVINGIKEVVLVVTKQEVAKIATSKTKLLDEAREYLEGIRDNLIEQATSNFHGKLDTITDDYLKKAPIPRVNIINLPDKRENRVTGIFHEKFEDILTITSLNEPLMLVGPAGSGKNVVISQAAKALDLPMYYTNNANNEFKITGFIDAGGNYRERPFYKAFKNGGIFFLDEIDNSDPSALIVLNAALANGYMDFPHETIEAHKDFRMVAAANTWGKGSDLQYVGRNALDTSTLDRFDTIFFDYDRNMEQALYPNQEILDYMWAFRDSVLTNRIQHIISTRGIGKVYNKHINDVPIELILKTSVLKSLSEDDINTILARMDNVNEQNPYLHETKVLNKVLKRKPPQVENYDDDDNDDLPF